MMIKDAVYAWQQTQEINTGKVTLKFQQTMRGTVCSLEQEQPIIFPKSEPTGVLSGKYLLGKIPRYFLDVEEMKKDWAVLRSNNKDKIELDYWPRLAVPVVVNLVGRSNAVEGMFVSYEVVDEQSSGQNMKGKAFLEIRREDDSRSYLPPVAEVKFGAAGNIEQVPFLVHDAKDVIGWKHLGVDSETFVPETAVKTIDLFADCEFDDATKSLISVGIVNSNGQFHYAYDTAAAAATQNEWIQKNVNTVLLEVPNGANSVWDLVESKSTFQEFLAFVLQQECCDGIWNVNIHVDFPTDVGYLAPLLHLGEGKRIGSMLKVQFHIDYVDGYPTDMKGAIQHNAASDALVLWYHLGYHVPAIFRAVTQNLSRERDMENCDPIKYL